MQSMKSSGGTRGEKDGMVSAEANPEWLSSLKASIINTPFWITSQCTSSLSAHPNGESTLNLRFPTVSSRDNNDPKLHPLKMNELVP